MTDSRTTDADHPFESGPDDSMAVDELLPPWFLPYQEEAERRREAPEPEPEWASTDLRDTPVMHDTHVPALSTRAAQREFRLNVSSMLAAHGFLTTPQLRALTGSDATDQAINKRLRRMANDQLVEQRQVLAVRCWVASKSALAMLGSPLPYLDGIADGRARHSLTVAQVAAEFSSAGWGITTERELRQEEVTHRDEAGYRAVRRDGTVRDVRVLPDGSRVRYGSQHAIVDWDVAWSPKHRPDLVAHDEDDPREDHRIIAIEVELTLKSQARLIDKLSWYVRSSRYPEVLYLCASPQIANAVLKAAATTARPAAIKADVLAPTVMAAALSGSTVTVGGDCVGVWAAARP